MKRFLLSAVFLLSAFSANAQLKPEAMTLPIDFTGVQSPEERKILQSHVINDLSAYYELKSEREVELARDQAVDLISSENCTEDACIKQMGELLDVEHIFRFSIIAAGDYWDLSATRLDFMGTTARRNAACDRCTLPRARLLLTELIVGLRPGTAVVKRGEAVLTLESEPRALVFLEGIEQGSTPLQLTVPTDRPAEILAVAEGYQDYSNLFELKPGERRKVGIRLVRRRGRVEISSEPSGAEIFLDAKPLAASGGQPLRTPSAIRPEYGEHALSLKLDRHLDFQTRLLINRPDLGTKTYTLKPNPGRLIVRVPPEFKNADVYVNENKIGNMEGKIARSFEVPAGTPIKIKANQGVKETSIETIEVEPESTKKVEFSDFAEATAFVERHKILGTQKFEGKKKGEKHREYYKIIGGYFSNTTDIYAMDSAWRNLYNNEFQEQIHGYGSLGFILRYFLLENLSLDAVSSYTGVSSIEYKNVINSNPKTDYTEQNKVSGSMSSLYILGNYVWNGGENSWMDEGWSLFAGGGFGSYSASYVYERDVIFDHEHDEHQTVGGSGISISFGFDYIFQNNWLTGLYFAYLFGGADGTRVESLQDRYYTVRGSSQVLNFSLGYSFK